MLFDSSETQMHQLGVQIIVQMVGADFDGRQLNLFSKKTKSKLRLTIDLLDCVRISMFHRFRLFVAA